VRAHADALVVDREVDDATAELEEALARVAVALVLLHSIFDRLLGEVVLEFEGGDRQAVDEQSQVEGELGFVTTVAELSRHAEAVRGEAFDGPRVAWRGRAVEEVDVVGAVLDPFTQHVDHAALADLALQASQKLAACRPIGPEAQRLDERLLRREKETAELNEVDAVLAVVLRGVTKDPAGATGDRGRGLCRDVLRREHVRAPGHGADDEFLEAFLAGIGGHQELPIK